MQILSKVIRLDLQYSSQQSHLYQRKTCYLAPFLHEEAFHFAKRMLAYLCLYERQPELAKHDPFGKQPDLFLRGVDRHYLLWCQVDLPNEKQLLRASHQADQVLLMPDSEQCHRAQALSKSLPNVHLFTLSNAQLSAFCSMLKGHMQLSVWRDENQLIVTDGQQQLEIQLTSVLGNVYTSVDSASRKFTAKH